MPGGSWMGFGSFGGLTHTTLTGAPFSATETKLTRRTLADGTQVQQQQQSTIYRDSAGRVRIDTTLGGSSSGGTQPARTVSMIYDPVAGYTYRLNAQTMTAVKSPLPQKNSANNGSHTPRQHSDSAQVTTQDLGTQTINGVSATGTQVTRTIPAGAIGNTNPIQVVQVTWASAALQIPVQVSVTDPRFGNTTTNLTNIVQTAPDASLFQVPANYTISDAPQRMRHGFAGRHSQQ